MKLTLTLLCLVACFVGCNRTSSPQTGERPAAPAPPSPPATPTAIKISTADLAKLKWIEGTWRGTGETQPPFFERYQFENESTLLMEELADETASVVKESTRYELKDGRFGTDRYVATAFDDKSITFSPLTPGRNSFRWQSESKDVWKAFLTLPATPTSSAKETIYTLQRIK